MACVPCAIRAYARHLASVLIAETARARKGRTAELLPSGTSRSTTPAAGRRLCTAQRSVQHLAKTGLAPLLACPLGTIIAAQRSGRDGTQIMSASHRASNGRMPPP